MPYLEVSIRVYGWLGDKEAEISRNIHHIFFHTVLSKILPLGPWRGVVILTSTSLILRACCQEKMSLESLRAPVNKWYFERCVGCMSAPRSQWKIFYTGDVFSKRIRSRGDGTYHKSLHVVDIADKLRDYLEICELIEPSFS